MKHLEIFEKWKSSPWPQTRHYRGSKILEIYDLDDPEVKKKADSLATEFNKKFGWFPNNLKDGSVDLPLDSDVFFVNMIRPDGKPEDLLFMDYEETDKIGFNETTGSVSTKTLDGKYDIWAYASDIDGSIEVDWKELDWSAN
jgi:hypothetical protein